MPKLNVKGKANSEMTWQADLLVEFSRLIRSGPLKVGFGDVHASGCGIHLAVLVEPYLSLILSGKKTIESRFSLNRQAPFERVFPGDILILKRSSGSVEGICLVSDAWFYQLKTDTWDDIERFSKALCMDDSPFWHSKRSAMYATLMRISGVVSIPHLSVAKLDPRGWVTLRDRISTNQGDLF
jgi:hypothetical protein